MSINCKETTLRSRVRNLYITRSEPRLYQHSYSESNNLWVKKVGAELVCAIGDLDHFIPLCWDLNGSH
jgi:hypothetical protein